MKKLLIALAAVMITAASYAQGTINFNTRFPAAGVNAPVELGQAGGPGPGPSYSAALYLVSGGTETLLPTSVTTFRDGSSNPLLAKYITQVVAEVPNGAAGQTAQVRMRAWQTSFGSYDATPAANRAESGVLTVTLGGGPTPPGDLPASFTGLIIPVPEPSTIALGVLGAAALLFRRRK